MGEKEQGAARESNAASESERKSGSVIMSDREAEGGVAAADLDDDGAPEAARGSITKSRSNIKNNREGGHTVGGDWDGMDIGDPGDETGRAKKPGGKVIVKDLKTHL